MAKPILFHYHTQKGKLDFFTNYIQAAHVNNTTILIVFPTKAQLEQYQESLPDTLRALINTTLFLGLRSNVMKNYATLATVIIDEEQHSLYREGRSPHVDATKIAEQRWTLSKVQLIFSSYAPSVTRYHKAQTGILEYIEHGEKVPLHATLIDMRNETKSAIGLSLQKAIQDTLAQNKKVLLLLNRRGLATIVLCSDCKKVCICPHCEVPTVFHKASRHMQCHHCEFQEPLPLFCAVCKNPDLQLRGKGTEKVVEEIQHMFNTATIARVDLDNPSFSAHEADSEGKPMPDITIGTQMLFTSIPTTLMHQVGLMGIVSADTFLNLPMVNAPERTFQLLVQTLVLGASYHIPIMVQTLFPEHYAILSALHNNAAAFYAHELSTRKQFSYPPYSHLIKLTTLHSTNLRGEQRAQKLYDMLSQAICHMPYTICLLPPHGSDKKIRGKYQWSLIIKSPVPPDDLAVHSLLAKVPQEWNIEVDPE